MNKLEQQYEVVVCGGGLAGLCAAVAAARHGARTCLIQDRPVLGGNSSSEIRVPPHGACCHHAYARETGIISELLTEERARNHEPIFENGCTNSVWDMVLYDLAVRTPNLTVHLNTSVTGVLMEGPGGELLPGVQRAAEVRGLYIRPACAPARRIAAVTARTANAEVELSVRGKLFIDCTGDGVVADWAGCEWRMGSEGRDEFGEAHAPPQPDTHTMGNSIHFKSRDMKAPCPFTPPQWAVRYEDRRFFYEGGRNPRDVRGGFWWIEIGVPWHTIHDAEEIRHELTRHCLGVWDWIKNRDQRTSDRAGNWALEWIGQVPGKRESRRVVGRVLMTENDIQQLKVFPDEIAFGGWFIDLHTPGGLLAGASEPASAEGYKATSEYAVRSYCGPYGIPLRILIARDVDNLMMAGRNVSVTKAALGTVRVMGTTAILGQAAGTAAAVALKRGISLADAPQHAAREVQQALLRDGCFLPDRKNEDPLDLARQARVTASSEALSYGAGPGSRGVSGGLADGRDPRPEAYRLEQRRGQWIALGAGELRKASVLLSVLGSDEQSVEARLLPVEHIWDYRCDPGAPLASATLRVAPGAAQWVEWPLALKSLTPGRYLRLDLLANPQVIWHPAGAVEPGQVSAFEIGDGRMRRFANGLTMSFLVDPPQPCYGPANVISGVARPHRFTNLWRSDPAQPLPQWVELAWPQPQQIALVELTFPGHLIREYHAYPPFYRDPQCARDFSICIPDGPAWREVSRAKGNYRRHVRVRLSELVTTQSLRVVIHATNGDPSAALYEVRCYGQ